MSLSELGLGSLLAFSYYSMRQESSSVKKLKLDEPVTIYDKAKNFNNVSDEIFHYLLGHKHNFSTVDLFNFIDKPGGEMPMTSAANYSGQILAGKLCDGCSISEGLPETYSSILKAMKYARQGGPAEQPVDADNPYIEDMKRILEKYNYSKVCGEYFGCLHSDPLILTSHLGPHKDNIDIYYECQLFLPTITFEGLAYSFNAAKLWETFRKTKPIQAFDTELRTGYPAPKDRCYEDGGVGIGHQLQFQLRQTYLDVLTRATTPFRVAIHSHDDLPDEFISLSPGYK